MKENIIQVDFRETYDANMVRYSLYVLYARYVSDIRDGLKAVQRRILYDMFKYVKCTSKATKVKSARTVGDVMGRLHPHSNCVDPETSILGTSGKIFKIGDLYDNDISSIEGFGVNPKTGKIEPVLIHDIRIGQYTNKLYHITFTNGATVTTTSNHPFMMITLQYKKAEDLVVGDSVLSGFYNRVTDVAHTDGFNLKVSNVYIEELDHEQPMYDFTVDTTHNMLVIADNDKESDFIRTVCVHNSSVYDAMKCLTNWFEIKMPLVNYDSNSGSLQGGPQAAMRYTESYMSKFALECVIGDLAESPKVVNWQHTFDNKDYEPESLPVKIPLLLVNGTFAIAIGRRLEVPSHSLNDVIDATVQLLHNSKSEIVLVPDPCQKCEVICEDFRKIGNTGYGHYIQRGIIKTMKNQKTGIETLRIMSTPDLVFSDSVLETIEKLIKENKIVQISDIQDQSTEEQLDIHLILKRGADANYVKQVLYKSTDLQSLKRVNMEIIDGLDIKRIDYKTYILYFLEYRRNVKFRLYNARLQKVATKQHEIEPYVKILDSGEVDKIIKLIKNQKSNDESVLIEYLIKKLDITDLQAKFILNVRIKQLTKANLVEYKKEYIELGKLMDKYYEIITNRKLIDKEIEQELLDIKAKYGKPRQSIIVTEAEASGIPEGEFKIVITENNFIKKLTVADQVRSIKGDNVKNVLIADNSKDILLFDNMGKVFKLAVNNIAFTDKSSPGIDIRLIVKKLTSNIICALYHPFVKALDEKRTKYYLVTVTKKGIVKKMDLGDIVNAIPSGLIYSRVNPDDEVISILIANSKCDVIINTRSKALRIPLNNIPVLKRTAIGPMGMKSKSPIEGASIVSTDTTGVIVVTYKGRFNKLLPSALPKSDRAKAGSKVISLVKNDYIVSIIPCSHNTMLRIINYNGEIVEIETDSIPTGSSVSSGTKLCHDGVAKVEIIKTNTGGVQ